MKKGSKLRKCWKCGKPLFWLIPKDKQISSLFVEVDYKGINPCVNKNGHYWCVDCSKKEGTK